MSDPQPPSTEAEREARIAELRELYDHLRDPGERGARAARIAWEQLGVATDLRTQLGASFQDTVKHRVGSAGMSDRFVRDARRKFGAGRPSLSEVDAPDGRRRRWPWRLAAALALAVGLGLLATVIVTGRSAEVPCRVAEVVGEAALGGTALVAGQRLDHRQVAVPAGSQLVLEWEDGSLAVVAGPANAVVQPSGLSLSSGLAWIAAAAPFTCGLPDDTARLAAGTRVATEVRESRSVVAVSEGSAALTARTLAAGEAASNAAVFAWVWHAMPYFPERTDASPDWDLDATARWRDPGESVALVVVDDLAKAGWSLRWRPGSIEALPLGADAPARSIALPGAPLGDAAVTLSAARGRLRVTHHGAVLFDEGLAPASSLGIAADGRSRLARASFHTGPPPAPPLPVRDARWR